VAVPSDHHTLYWCKIVQLPPWPKHHMIKASLGIGGKPECQSVPFVRFQYEPIIQPGNEPFVHHILVYHCPMDMSAFVDKEEACFSKDNSQFSPMYACTTRYLAGWAVGGEVRNPVYFPRAPSSRLVHCRQ
jgi:Copper type II ascorbate-dependent monooxygenase, N-terminal domain